MPSPALLFSPPYHLHLLHSIGLTTTALLTGHLFTLCTPVLSSILTSPASQLLRQWRILQGHNDSNDKSEGSNPLTHVLGTKSGALFICGLFAWIAYETPNTVFRPSAHFSQRTLDISVAALLALYLPYTIMLMGPTSHELMRRANELSIAEVEALDAKAHQIAGEKMSLGQIIRVVFGIDARNLQFMSTHQLVDLWGMLNYGRVGLVSVAGIIALFI